MNLMGSGLWGVGFSVVQARTKKLLKRFMATPMRRSHYLLSFILSRLVFLFLEVAALVGFGWWMFHVGVRGSFSAVAFITVLGALSFAGLGMLVASRARTIEAVSGLMNLVMLPMWILSGTFFSYARFPRDAAVCEGAPTHRAERCPPCRHDRREPAPRAGRPVRHRDGMGSRELRGGAADLPLALGPRPRGHFPQSSARSRNKRPRDRRSASRKAVAVG